MYTLKNESWVIAECSEPFEYHESQRAWLDPVRDIYFVDPNKTYVVEEKPDQPPVTDGGPSVTG